MQININIDYYKVERIDEQTNRFYDMFDSNNFIDINIVPFSFARYLGRDFSIISFSQKFNNDTSYGSLSIYLTPIKKTKLKIG